MPSRPAAVQIKHSRPVRRFESFLRRCLRAVVAAFEHRDALTRILLFNFRAEHLDAAEIRGEYDHPLLRILHATGRRARR